MSEWKEVRLGDISTINAGGDAPRENMSKEKNEKFSIPIFSNGIDNKGLYGFTNKAIIKSPACTITARGTIGVVFNRKEPYYPIVRLISVVADESIIKSDFLYYSLRNTRIKGDGSVQEQFTVPMAKDIHLKIPTSIEIQSQISDILSSLDAKIETNNKLNEKLQEMAQAIFKSWFVDFEPFKDKPFHETELGMIPEGWEVKRLCDIVDNIGGYSYKGNELKESTTAMCTIKNFERNGGFKIDGYKEIIPSDKLKASQELSLFDVVVAHTDLTQNAEVIGNPAIILSKSKYDRIIFSMDLTKVISKNMNVSKSLLYCILRNKRFKNHALGYVNGTTVLHMSKKAVPDYMLAFPKDSAILVSLSKCFDSIFGRMHEIYEENDRLASLRDTLLPRLMSGEIKI